MCMYVYTHIFTHIYTHIYHIHRHTHTHIYICISCWFCFSDGTLPSAITISDYMIIFLSHRTISTIETGMVSVLFTFVFLVPRV